MICRINVSSYRFWLPLTLLVVTWMNMCWRNIQLNREIVQLNKESAQLRQQLELYKFYTPPAHHTPFPMVE